MFAVQFFSSIQDVLCTLNVYNVIANIKEQSVIQRIIFNSSYCLQSDYYLLDCSSHTVITTSYLSFSQNHSLSSQNDFKKILFLSNSLRPIRTVPEDFHKTNFDRNQPLSGERSYPIDYTDNHHDFTCNEAGYLDYLNYWPIWYKSTSRDPSTSEFQKRLRYFIQSCQKIHQWNARKNKYQMEFTYYADWHPDEFEEITTTKQHYTGMKGEMMYTIPVHNNSALRYLMPSLDPCYDILD